MAIIRWNPWTDMEVIRRQMDRVFDDMTGWDGYSATSWQPKVELFDSEDRLTLRAEIPGLEPKDLDISASRNTIALRGERRYENEHQDRGYFRSEFHYGKFERTIELPANIENDRVEADYKNGILTLTLPKEDADRNRAVKVNLSATSPELEGEEVSTS
ncbi:Hsp20/alpha crystallin family protein [Oscillatoriales cyanobacterium LEGE 11467]|uniref:Hsp20/alpha crystallin family protein n=1 Tax=Zarconia navalis LEGE 11467 TaxID=1828826 RepID=A0A928Z9L2_9CYAN|nr:Hsp20/alpha crystallin family protein [Zarconia navalis]MBE9041798.1 Hsp20/alpha crystallin family protein [Zarconia navalis LEGE 11467]